MSGEREAFEKYMRLLDGRLGPSDAKHIWLPGVRTYVASLESQLAAKVAEIAELRGQRDRVADKLIDKEQQLAAAREQLVTMEKARDRWYQEWQVDHRAYVLLRDRIESAPKVWIAWNLNEPTRPVAVASARCSLMPGAKCTYVHAVPVEAEEKEREGE